MSFVIAIIVGLMTGTLVGGLARLLLPGEQKIPLWLTALLGFAGAEAGNLGATAFHVAHTAGIDWIRHFLQIATATILVAIAVPLWRKLGES
jgi:uncharacterized membrane protein YeaQ/YmgE (transglycosylase-associated protein family)